MGDDALAVVARGGAVLRRMVGATRGSRQFAEGEVNQARHAVGPATPGGFIVAEPWFRVVVVEAEADETA